MNFKFEDGDYFYGGDSIKVSSAMIKEMSVEDFNTYVESVESQIREIEKENKGKEERERVQAAEAADKKRKIIMDRISKIDCAKIEKDGLYLDIYGIGKEFLIDYESIYGFTDEAATEYLHKTNLSTSKKILDLEKKKEEAEQLRLERLEIARKAKEDAERLALVKDEADRKAAMSDKNKLKAIADDVHELKKEINNNYSLTSDSGRTIFSRVINDLKLIVEFIDSKIK